MKGSVRIDGDYLHISIPKEDCHALRVALHPIRAGETTSASTQAIRDRLDKALARVQAGVK